MRLDKYLSHSGYGSRKDVKKIISSGGVAINGLTAKKANDTVDPDSDLVTYYGEKIHYQQYYYLMLNKPKGIISATADNQYQTVIDWVALDYSHTDLFPVGRLDIDTTGLLLLTNNGKMAHQLLSPKKLVKKTYQANVRGIIGLEEVKQFAEGLNLGDFTSLPAELVVISSDENLGESVIQVTITEGKFHQVKRMFEKVGSEVMELHRLSMGPLSLDPHLSEGEYRELTREEMTLLEPYGLQ